MLVAPGKTTGAAVSSRVNVSEQAAELELVSYTVKLTTCSPNPISLPAGGLWVTRIPPHESVATSSEEKTGTVTKQLVPIDRERLVGQKVMAGASISTTV